MNSLSSKDSISQKAANEVFELVKSKPDFNLGLPTGRTPDLFYKHLVELSRKNQVDWSKARFFGLDEYREVDSDKTFKFYLEKYIYKPLNIEPAQCFTPLETDNYDKLIEEVGGLDLTILGIGKNGHIAFNEPPANELSWTHSVWLHPSTREANKDFFDSIEVVPRKAVTMGIQTLLSSKRTILLAFGEKKKAILDKALHGPIDSNIPASFLQKHKNLSVFTDFEFSP